MRYFKKLAGENLYLSPMNPDDAEQYTVWLNDPEVSVWLAQHTKVISLYGERKFLESLSTEGYNFAIVGNDDKLIGNCSLFDVCFRTQRATCGIFIGDAGNRGKGYGAEALRLLLDYGFRSLNLHSVMLTLFEDNAQALECYKKVGFQMMGRRRESWYINGKRRDTLCMDILKDEFYGNA